MTPTGLVQANAVGGPVSISATFNGVPGTSSVTVTQVPRFVDVTPTSAALDSAQTQPFAAVARDSNSNVIPAAPFTWTSLKPLVASVSGAGTASALGGGQTTIRATTGPASGYALVTVSQRNYGTPVGAWVTSDTGAVGSWRDLWAADANNVFVVGQSGQIRRWNGSAWSLFATLPGSPGLFGIWGTSPTDVWVAGSGGGIWHYDGVAFTQQAVIGSGHWAMWGSSPNDVFAVGSGGVIAHYNGTAWSTMSHPAGATQFYSVWGTGPDDVYVVGASGTILRYNGSIWSTEPNGGIGTTPLHGVWGAGPDSVFAVGGPFSGSTAILRRVGGVWTPMTSGSAINLY
ncbi:MAG: Ig-like domain-containing protein, partial [Gemmatimonadales bacterium]